jgi:hypothetical protein
MSAYGLFHDRFGSRDQFLELQLFVFTSPHQRKVAIERESTTSKLQVKFRRFE